MKENLVYDIGMHNGDDTAYYLSLGYEVVAIEASPDLAKKGLQRFKAAIESNRLTILNIGIGAIKGVTEFYLNKVNSVWNSFDKEIGERGGGGYDLIEVQTESVEQVMKQHGVPYYMKIDIEGNDILCLNALLVCDEKPLYISAEVNEIEIIEKLKELGYTKFKLVDQFRFIPLEIPVTEEFKAYKSQYKLNKSMNIFVRLTRKFFGKYINKYYDSKILKLFNYRHLEGSSGPFGESIKTNWVSYEEIIKVYHFYKTSFEKSTRFVGFNYWIDVHATK